MFKTHFNVKKMLVAASRPPAFLVSLAGKVKKLFAKKPIQYIEARDLYPIMIDDSIFCRNVYAVLSDRQDHSGWQLDIAMEVRRWLVRNEKEILREFPTGQHLGLESSQELTRLAIDYFGQSYLSTRAIITIDKYAHL